MGVRYDVSALHLTSYLEASKPVSDTTLGSDPGTRVPGDIPGTYKVIQRVPLRFRSPSEDDILAWWGQIAIKYQDQLGENPSWDEGSNFCDFGEAVNGSDTALRYVAAVLDQRGPDAASALINTTLPPYPEMTPIYEETNRRGFAGQFPQLLLVTNFLAALRAPSDHRGAKLAGKSVTLWISTSPCGRNRKGASVHCCR